MIFYLSMATMTWGYLIGSLRDADIPITLQLLYMFGCSALWPVFWAWGVFNWTRNCLYNKETKP